MMRHLGIVAALVSIAPFANALGQPWKQAIGFGEAPEDAFQLAGKDIGGGQILVSEDDYWGVIRAAGDLALDFGRVTGTNYTLSNGKKGSGPALFEFEPVDVGNNTHVRDLWSQRTRDSDLGRSMRRQPSRTLKVPGTRIPILGRPSSLSERLVIPSTSTT